MMDSGYLLQFMGGLTLTEKAVLTQIIPQAKDLGLLSLRELERVLDRSLGRVSWKPRDLIDRAQRSWEAGRTLKMGVFKWEDQDYPAQLKEIYDAPFRLYYRGEKLLWDRPMLALVGTRNPTEKGRRAAWDLGAEAAGAGLWTVSGLARGIDEAVHRGTLSNNGRTLGVLACGLDQVYPRSNAALAGKILQSGGTLVSEHPPLVPPLRHHFPQRNRIISGLCRGVVLVQAPVRSGALITTSLALEQGRDIFVCPEGYHPLAGAGGLELERQGAVEIQKVSQVLESWERNTLGEKTPVYGGRRWTA